MATEPTGQKCEDCGQVKPDVEETTCPYDEEINGVESVIVVCGDCLQQRANDI